VLLGGADLGGHLSFGIGVNVNRTAWEQPPQQWTPVLADTELADGKPCKADAGGAPVLLYRTAGTVYALASTCTHMGGPLVEGTISDGCVTCPWHGSTFRFADGSIVRGPGHHPRALLSDARPGRAYRGPRFHIGVADLSHRRRSSQKTPFCAPRTDPTKEAVPLQNGGSASVLPDVPVTHRNAVDRRSPMPISDRSSDERSAGGRSRPSADLLVDLAPRRPGG
jgi:nitrite reductase/ring-hydroxylating ferredoxin subunit